MYKPSYSRITVELADRIRQAVGAHAVVSDQNELEKFARDATRSYHLPDLVVEATSTEQVQALLRLASEHRFPVTPRGLGTGLAGGAVPELGGVVLSLEKMNRIVRIEKENMIAVVEPGVINLDLKNAARSKGLYYPPDPASLDTCSIGGNAATNAGGSSCVKYGTTRDYVLGLQAVLPSGEMLWAGVQTRKGVVGYDLAHLLVGSEGTLAVITQLILRLIPHPPAVGTLVILFRDLKVAMQAVSAVLQGGHTPCAMEFLDRRCLELVGDLLPFDGLEEAGAFLLIETDGPPTVIEKEVESMGEVCLRHGAVNAVVAPDSYKRAKMWEVRKQVSLRIEHQAPHYVPEDVVVPIARIAEFVEGLPRLERQYGMQIYSFGHAGDGNIHLNITAADNEAMERVEEGVVAILKQVVSMGGTISGEHGIGLAKKRFVPLELSASSLSIQKGIKSVFDPYHILNPGKVF